MNLQCNRSLGGVKDHKYIRCHARVFPYNFSYEWFQNPEIHVMLNKTDADKACNKINKICRNCPAVAIRSLN